MPEIFVGEVVSVGDVGVDERPSPAETPVGPFAITVKVIDSLKGGASGARRFLQVGAPSSCQIQLDLGARRIFYLGGPSQKVVGYCSVMALDEGRINALRSAIESTK
jgi:hypothetical protein